MIDLHIHTVFSDGVIDNLDLFKNHDLISVTDHNSILAYKELSAPESDRYIMGVEITIVGMPDYLVYFPGMGFHERLEERLSKIRANEEIYIQKAYGLSGYSNWTEDKKLSFSDSAKVFDARTKNLAAIYYKYRKSEFKKRDFFEKEDLVLARSNRKRVSELSKYKPDELEPFRIAKDFSGVIVLAHPIRTALNNLNREATESDNLKKEIGLLLDDFYAKGGRIIEWEYFCDEDVCRYSNFIGDVINIKRYLSTQIEKYDFKVTLGSDIHRFNGYGEASKWLETQMRFLNEKIPDYMKIPAIKLNNDI